MKKITEIMMLKMLSFEAKKQQKIMNYKQILFKEKL